jgi:hypothetical protein
VQGRCQTGCDRTASPPSDAQLFRGCAPSVVTFSGARAGNMADVLYFVTFMILSELLRKLLHDHPINLVHDAVSLNGQI